MPFDLSKQIHRVHRREISWSVRDAVLYALGISLLEDPLDASQLRFVREPCAVTFPTFAAALARNAAPTIGDLGGDYAGAVLLAERLELHQEIPPAGVATAESRIVAVHDRGPERGAAIAVRTLLIDANGATLASATALTLARHDGGCGSSGQPLPSPPPAPTRVPDGSVNIATRPDQAIIYALTGDANPLHLDPAAARQRGFPRPILHGLCTYALAARAVISGSGADPAALQFLEARFVAPVFPGETLRVDLWRTGPAVAFEVFVLERDLRVLADGTVRIG